MPAKLYSLRDVSKIVGRSQRSLYRDIEDGRLQAAKVGGQWRVKGDALEAFIDGMPARSTIDFETLLSQVRGGKQALTPEQRMALVSELAVV